VQPGQEISLSSGLVAALASLSDPRCAGGQLAAVELARYSSGGLARLARLGQHLPRMIGKRDESHTASIDARTPISNGSRRRLRTGTAAAPEGS
jgi:hypothetical protein